MVNFVMLHGSHQGAHAFAEKLASSCCIDVAGHLGELDFNAFGSATRQMSALRQFFSTPSHELASVFAGIFPHMPGLSKSPHSSELRLSNLKTFGTRCPQQRGSKDECNSRGALVHAPIKTVCKLRTVSLAPLLFTRTDLLGCGDPHFATFDSRGSLAEPRFIGAVH